MATKDTVKRPRGGQLLGDRKMITHTFRASEDQLLKLDALGGAAWLRAAIDAAPWPRGTKPRK